MRRKLWTSVCFSRFPCRPGISHNQAFQECFDQVYAAEKLGFDTFWLGEEHFSPELFLSSSIIAIASAIAATTSRLRIGLAVVPLPLGHPIRVAEEAATIDQISQGRLEFGVGRSSNIQTYRGYGVPYTQSRGRMLESLDVIKKAWTEEKFSHQGEFFSFQNVSLAPKPYQRPHPPISIAVTNPETYALAGRLGYNIVVSPRGEKDLLRQHFNEYRKAWKEAGHSGDGKIVARLLVYVAETEEQAYADPEEGTMGLLRFQASMFVPLEGLSDELNRARTERGRALASITYDEVLRTDATYGTPEAVAEAMEEYRDDLGVSGFMLDMNCFGGLSPEQVLNAMRLFSERVMPRLK